MDGAAVLLQLGPAGAVDAAKIRLILGYEFTPPPPSPIPATELNVDFLFKLSGKVAVDSDRAFRWAPSQVHRATPKLPISPSIGQPSDFRAPWAATIPLSTDQRMAWDSTVLQAADYRLPWFGSIRLHTAVALPWGIGGEIARAMVVPWGIGERGRIDRQAVWAVADEHRTNLAFPWSVSAFYYQPVSIPIHPGARLRWVEWPAADPPPPPPPPPGGVRGDAVWLPLRTAQRAGDRVTLSIGEEAITGTHFVNTLSVVTWPDDLPVHVSAVSFATDMASWGHSISLTVLDATSLDLIRPTGGAYVDIKVTVNSYGRVFTVLRWRRSRGAAGRTTWTAEGVGQIARLAGDFAGTRTYTEPASRTLVQLMEQEIDGTGWSLDATGYPDVTVPGGIHSYQDQSPLALLMDLAGAAGWYVRGHPTARTVQVRSRWPVAPWDWDTATPDVTIPDGAWTQIEEQSQSGTEGDRVYVMGDRTGGILYQGTRDGTGGTQLLPDVVDRYIVHPDIGYARARAEIAQHIPVQPGTARVVLPPDGSVPLLQLGDLISIGGVRALVTSIRVDAQRSAGALTVWQTIAWGAENSYSRFTGLTPPPPRSVGTVAAVLSSGIYTVELPSGDLVQARGGDGWQINDVVYLEGGVIISAAPALPFYSGAI